MKYYITDNNNKKRYYNHTNEIVNAAEQLLIERFGVNRRGYMQHLIDLGHGYDDPEGRTFIESLKKLYEIGIVKKDKHVPCNIHDADKYSKYKEEMGD